MNRSLLVLLHATTLAGCAPRADAGAPTNPEPHPARVPSVSPAPPDNPTTLAKVALGRQLFFDKRLSSTGQVSCHDCHRVTGPEPGGTDGAAVATGVFGLRGGRNAPTVYNAALREALFWDGRAAGLEQQAEGPLLNPIEMGNASGHDVVAAVRAVPAYREALDRIFAAERAPGAGPSFREIVQAIAAYERTLITPRSPFDRFHAGERDALDARAQRGWQTFQRQGCVGCHGAPTFTGEDYFVRFPLFSVPEDDRRHGLTRDQGRYEVTRAPWDRNRWRVPSLRNVARTGPYLHNGAISELADVVRLMGRAQLGRVLADDDVEDIVAFLRSLTGEAPVEAPPELPR